MEAEKCIPTSSVAAAKGEVTINDLDTESLGIVFNYLPYRYRVGVESVCKHWREVSKANWWSYSKHLTINEDRDTFPSLHYSPKKNQNILQKTLERRGQYLEEITFTDVDSESFEGGTIKKIVECCPRLKYLNTGKLKLNSEDWFACSNLEGLSCRQDYDTSAGAELRELFRRNKRLRLLKIERVMWRTCPYDLQCTARNFSYLDPGQLKILHIVESSDFEFTACITDKLAESLVELNFEPSYEPLYETHHLQHLSKLKNLRTLILNFSSIMEKIENILFFIDIAKNCKKLEQITLYFCYMDDDKFNSQNLVNPTFIPLLLDLPCLKSLVLIIESGDEIPYDRLFGKAPNLQFFELRSSYNVKTYCNYYKYCRTVV